MKRLRLVNFRNYIKRYQISELIFIWKAPGWKTIICFLLSLVITIEQNFIVALPSLAMVGEKYDQPKQTISWFWNINSHTDNPTEQTKELEREARKWIYDNLISSRTEQLTRQNKLFDVQEEINKLFERLENIEKEYQLLSIYGFDILNNDQDKSDIKLFLSEKLLSTEETVQSHQDNIFFNTLEIVQGILTPPVQITSALWYLFSGIFIFPFADNTWREEYWSTVQQTLADIAMMYIGFYASALLVPPLAPITGTIGGYLLPRIGHALYDLSQGKEVTLFKKKSYCDEYDNNFRCGGHFVSEITIIGLSFWKHAQGLVSIGAVDELGDPIAKSIRDSEILRERIREVTQKVVDDTLKSRNPCKVGNLLLKNNQDEIAKTINTLNPFIIYPAEARCVQLDYLTSDIESLAKKIQQLKLDIDTQILSNKTVSAEQVNELSLRITEYHRLLTQQRVLAKNNENNYTKLRDTAREKLDEATKLEKDLKERIKRQRDEISTLTEEIKVAKQQNFQWEKKLEIAKERELEAIQFSKHLEEYISHLESLIVQVKNQLIQANEDLFTAKQATRNHIQSKQSKSTKADTKDESLFDQIFHQTTDDLQKNEKDIAYRISELASNLSLHQAELKAKEIELKRAKTNEDKLSQDRRDTEDKYTQAKQIEKTINGQIDKSTSDLEQLKKQLQTQQESLNQISKDLSLSQTKLNEAIEQSSKVKEFKEIEATGKTEASTTGQAEASPLGNTADLQKAGLRRDYIDKLTPEQQQQVKRVLARWNLDATGKNQGVIHILDYAEGAGGAEKTDRLQKLADYTGTTPFDVHDPTLIPKVTNTLDELIGQTRTLSKVNGDKTIYFIPKKGATLPGTGEFANGQKGIIVIKYGGKYASFMNADYRNYKNKN